MGKAKTLDIRKQNQKVIAYLDLAFDDYIVARHLLINGFLEHGTMLASTSVEKYIKAVIGIYGVNNQSHLCGALMKLLKNNQSDLYDNLNIDFLEFLEKAYKLRYALTNSAGLSIVINQFKTLIALDELIYKLDSGFEMTINGEAVLTPYQRKMNDNYGSLLIHNVILNPTELSNILRLNNKVMELKIEDNFDVLRFDYETIGVNLNNPFLQKPDITLKKNKYQLTLG